MKELGVTNGVLARRLKMKRGALSSLLEENGAILYVIQVLEILRALEIPRQVFYGRLYGFPTADPETTKAQLADAARRWAAVRATRR